MELVYITHHSILDLHIMSPFLSWAIVIGALYGLARLVRDATRWLLAGARRIEGIGQKPRK
jgi:hypothetical protein